MKKKISPIVWFSAGCLLTAILVIAVSFRINDKTESTVEVKQDGRLQYKWYIPELPKQISFAGEKVPLDRWDVREQFSRELLSNYYQHGTLLYILQLSSRYFPVIEERLKANGVPDDFKYLCVAESALRNQTSPANASGYWQFVPATAERYGLEVNDQVDERYNLVKSTDAACKFLNEAYSKFGSWTAAAASYNCGQGGYNKFASYQHTTNNYYDIMLPEETMRYVFRILAFKYLIGNSMQMGFMLNSIEQYHPVKTKTIDITASVPDLAQFAIDNGSSYRMLKLLNPWLRDHELTVKPGKTYQVELPVN